MEGSKLPYRYWLAGMNFLTSNDSNFSIKSIQNDLGHKRYEPIWKMLYKINNSLIDKEKIFNITEQIILNEGFFLNNKP